MQAHREIAQQTQARTTRVAADDERSIDAEDRGRGASERDDEI